MIGDSISHPNPFPFPAKGLPSGQAERFVLRPDVLLPIEASFQDLEQGRFHGLRFVGERGAGKTSIFDYLSSVVCPQRGILPILINVVDVASRDYTVLEEIIDSIKRVAIAQYGLYRFRQYWWSFSTKFRALSSPWVGIELGEPTAREVIQKAQRALVSHYEALKEAAGIRAILIMIDDADNLGVDRLGRIGSLYNGLAGYIIYLAMGTEPSPATSREATMGHGGPEIPQITDVRSGVLAYWERVVVDRLREPEIEKMIRNCLPDQNWKIPDEDMRLIVNLSGGNGRVAMLLAHMSARLGLQECNGQILLHMTSQVVERAKEADENLAVKLMVTEEILRERDPEAIRPRWW